MAQKRFCKVVIIEGEEDRLRDAWSREINTGGATMYADGVRYGSAQVDLEDLLLVAQDKVQNLLVRMGGLRPVELEDVD